MAIPRFNRTASINTSLFSGYINARNEWSYTELQLTILNMLMFAPQGFFYPILSFIIPFNPLFFDCICGVLTLLCLSIVHGLASPMFDIQEGRLLILGGLGGIKGSFRQEI